MTLENATQVLPAAASISVQGARDRCALRKFDRVSVGVADNGKPRHVAQRDRRSRFARPLCKRMSVLVERICNLKSDIAPTRPRARRIGICLRILFQHKKGLACPEAAKFLLRETEDFGIKTPVRGQVANGEPDADLVDALCDSESLPSP